jgi:hypothetical protein
VRRNVSDIGRSSCGTRITVLKKMEPCPAKGGLDG